MLNILPLDKLHTYSLYMFLYKIINNVAPPVVRNWFPINSNIHTHVTRQSSQIHVQQISSPSRERALRHQSIMLYNCDDHVAQYDLGYVSFKKFIRSYLLEL